MSDYSEMRTKMKPNSMYLTQHFQYRVLKINVLEYNITWI